MMYSIASHNSLLPLNAVLMRNCWLDDNFAHVTHTKFLICRMWVKCYHYNQYCYFFNICNYVLSTSHQVALGGRCDKLSQSPRLLKDSKAKCFSCHFAFFFSDSKNHGNSLGNRFDVSAVHVALERIRKRKEDREREEEGIYELIL